MPADTGKKLFVGPRFRRIRQQLGLSQTQIAEGLGISPSYVNLIERNQRPVTAQILLRLAEAYDLDLRDLHDLADDQQPEFFSSLAQEFQRIFTVPLKRIWRTPRLERSSPQHFRAGFGHRFCSRKKLLARFHRAGPGHHNDFVPADPNSVAQLDNGPLRPKTSPCEFVGRADPVHFLHARQQFEIADIEIDPRPDRPQNRHPRTSRPVHFKTQLHQVLDYLLYKRLIGTFLHRHNHKKPSAFSCQRPATPSAES